MHRQPQIECHYTGYSDKFSNTNFVLSWSAALLVYTPFIEAHSIVGRELRLKNCTILIVVVLLVVAQTISSGRVWLILLLGLRPLVLSFFWTLSLMREIWLTCNMHFSRMKVGESLQERLSAEV